MSEAEAGENFTDQKPRIATERHLKLPWNGRKEANFRCYLCGHKFKLGDTWRWVFMGGALCNFITCAGCDTPDVKDKWRALNEEWDTVVAGKYWWFVKDN